MVALFLPPCQLYNLDFLAQTGYHYRTYGIYRTCDNDNPF
jgi:hypothetical protein